MEIETRAAAPSPDSSIGDSFAWPFRDPDWFSKIVLMGLISLIPIVGWLQLLGWMLTCLDNLRHGLQQLPPAAFRYASRGVHVFLASLVWGLIAAVVIYGSLGLLVFTMVSLSPNPHSEAGTSSAAPPFFLFPLMFGLTGFFGLLSIAAFLFVPMIVLFADRTGFGGAFNIAGFIRALRSSPRQSLATGGLTLARYFIGEMGSYLCYVGLLFTVPYSMAVVAGLLRWYEVHANPGSLPAAPAAAS